ncbi:MAG: calcium/sodium antiporter [bacterium]
MNVLSVIVFIAGFIFLIKGADFLIDGASITARKFGISDMVIGLSIVAFGTSAPELFVNIFASMQGNSQITIGNIMGSNIFNTFLILGISAVIFPLKVAKNTVRKEIPFNLLSGIILFILAADIMRFKFNQGIISRNDGLILLILFCAFLYYLLISARKQPGVIPADYDNKNRGALRIIILIAGGLVLLNIGAKWVVAGAVKIAESFGVDRRIIGLTIVAAGTSLPELAASAVAAFKKRPDIAVGNIIGSNIFNILFILGISSIIRPLEFVSANFFDLTVVIFSSILIFITMFTGGRRMLDRWEGIVFVFLYITYLCFILQVY